MTGTRNGVGRRRPANTGAGRVEISLKRLAPALTRWLKAEHVGTIGLAVLLAGAVLAIGLAIHGYGNRGLALPSVATSAASPGRSQPHPTTTTSKGATTNSTSGSTSTSTTNSTSGSTYTSTTSPAVKLGPALSSTQYASYAYRIYPGSVSGSAQQAMAGYSISTKVSGANVVVAVSTAGSSQAPSQKTYPAADTVYFVEASLGDDSGTTELNPGDDGLIVTNPQGRIVEG
jgi:hypothetical protein